MVIALLRSSDDTAEFFNVIVDRKLIAQENKDPVTFTLTAAKFKERTRAFFHV